MWKDQYDRSADNLRFFKGEGKTKVFVFKDDTNETLFAVTLGPNVGNVLRRKLAKAGYQYLSPDLQAIHSEIVEMATQRESQQSTYKISEPYVVKLTSETVEVALLKGAYDAVSEAITHMTTRAYAKWILDSLSTAHKELRHIINVCRAEDFFADSKQTDSMDDSKGNI